MKDEKMNLATEENKTNVQRYNNSQPTTESADIVKNTDTNLDEADYGQESPILFLRHLVEERNDEEDSSDELLEHYFHKGKTKKHQLRWIIGVISAGFILLIGTLVLLGVNDIYGIFTSEGESVQIEITSGATVDDIANTLEKNGVIEYSLLFRVYVKYQNAQASLYPGLYQLNENSDYNTILSTLKDPSKNLSLISFVIPEGQNIMDIAASLEEKSICSADKFLSVINDPSVYSDYSFTKYLTNKELQNHYYPMEGYVFPATYSISKDSTVEEIARMFLDTTDKKLSSLISDIEDSGYSMDEVMTIASIIQAEAGTIEDMVLISSVLHNRLKNSKSYNRLECDPTRKYAEQLELQGGASSAEVDEYNTYSSYGLPPGPICNPGIDAIEAALYPADTEYMYFCSNIQTKDCYYATTLEEHNQNLVKAGLA